MSEPPATAFAAFILTHGRPDNVLTHGTLRKCGYTGRIVLMVDDEDTTLPEYVRRYGSEVETFSKPQIAATFDAADNFADRRTIVYARNAAWDVARRLGLTHFVQLDDDYTELQYRFDENYCYTYSRIRSLDKVFEAMVHFVDSTSILTVAMSQGGDFIGGSHSSRADHLALLRKAMNLFVCRTDRRFYFVGRINEDVNAYSHLASLGNVFFTTTQVLLNQMQTQSNPGGMTGVYLDGGTYLKSFYSVLFQPSSVKIGFLRERLGKRFHHRITWSHTHPMILRQDIRRGAPLRSPPDPEE